MIGIIRDIFFDRDSPDQAIRLMNMKLTLLPCHSKPPNFHCRKRPPYDRMSDDSLAFSESGNDSQDDQEFTLVTARRLKRRMRNAAQNSPSSASTIITPGAHSLTVVFTTVRLTDNLTAISKPGASMFLENLAPSKSRRSASTF